VPGTFAYLALASKSVRLRWHRPRGFDRGSEPRVLQTKEPPCQQPVAASLAAAFMRLSSWLWKRRGGQCEPKLVVNSGIGEEPGAVVVFQKVPNMSRGVDEGEV
jgi:hypothetical protein